MKKKTKSLRHTAFVVAARQFIAILAEREHAGIRRLLEPKTATLLGTIVESLTEDKLHSTIPKITDIISGHLGRFAPHNNKDDLRSLSRLGSALLDMSKGMEELSDTEDAEWLVHVLQIESQRVIKKMPPQRHRQYRL
jgi:hypothetical protein